MQTDDQPRKSELVWSDDYSVGNAFIDDDHKAFFKICSILHKAKDISDLLLIESAMQVLEEYVDGHFLREEKAMTSVGYPRFADHKLKHGHFNAKVKAAGETFRMGILTAVNGLPELVEDWLVQHILHEDMQFKNWIRNAAVDERPLAFLALEASQKGK